MRTTEHILEALKTGPATVPELAGRTGRSTAACNRYAGQLVKEGRVLAEGRPRVFRLAGPVKKQRKRLAPAARKRLGFSMDLCPHCGDPEKTNPRTDAGWDSRQQFECGFHRPKPVKGRKVLTA